jgi:hypothetical protein
MTQTEKRNLRASDAAINEMVLDGTDPKLVAYAQKVSLAKVYKNITRLQLRKMYVSPTERQKLIASRKGINL